MKLWPSTGAALRSHFRRKELVRQTSALTYKAILSDRPAKLTEQSPCEPFVLVTTWTATKTGLLSLTTSSNSDVMLQRHGYIITGIGKSSKHCIAARHVTVFLSCFSSGVKGPGSHRGSISMYIALRLSDDVYLHDIFTRENESVGIKQRNI